MSIYLHHFASIQQRTSPVKFARPSAARFYQVAARFSTNAKFVQKFEELAVAVTSYLLGCLDGKVEWLD